MFYSHKNIRGFTKKGKEKKNRRQSYQIIYDGD